MSSKPASDVHQALTPTDLSPIDQFRSRHQTAVLVVLFTDLQGSTELAEKRGETYARSVRQNHDQMLREIIERDGAGTCIKNIGDALMCIFAEPTTAVERAIQIQEALAAYNAAHPDEPPLVVRIGMHMGQVSVEGDVNIDVFGRHVNRAARIESLADGGQILMTEPVHDSASGWLAEHGYQWADHGRYLLKGIKDPTHVFEVCTPSSTGPHTPQGNRVRDRKWIAWAVALLVVAALVPVAWWSRPRQEPLVSQLDVRVVRNDELSVSLNEALPLRDGDALQLIGRLSRPAYARLVWVDAEGQVAVLDTGTSGEQKVKQIVFPPGEDNWQTLTGQPGTEICLLVTSDDPLTDLRELVAQLESTGPFSSLEKAGAIWIEADKIEEVAAPEEAFDERPRGLGVTVHRPSEKPEYQADKLRHALAEKFTGFDGVVFTHDSPW